jgi:hypothetical protein
MKRCKGRHRRLLVALTVSTTVFFVLSPGIALADEIVDPPVATVDTVEPTVDATVDTVETTVPVETVDPTPVETVEPTPVDAVDPTPVETVDPTPVDTVDPTPVETVDPTPVDPTPDATFDTVEPTPDVTVDPIADPADAVLDPVGEPASGPTPETASEPFPEVVVTEPTPEVVSGPTPEAAMEPFPEVVVTEPIPEAVSGPTPETAMEPFPEVVVTEPTPEVVSGPTPETAMEPFPEVIADPIPEVVTDPVPEVIADPIPEVVADPTPEVASEPIPAPIAEPIPAPISEPIPAPIAEPIPASISEPIPAPVAAAPEPVLPATVDETPMTVTATTELFSSEESGSPRITSEELPQKLQDDPFNTPELDGIGLTQTVLMVTSSQAIVGSKAGSVQVDGPVSCSGSAPCGVRNSPNDPGSFVESIAELLRQLALTGSGALDLMKLALILAFVGAFAIWGTRRRPITSGIDQKRTLRSGGLLHRQHGTMRGVSDRRIERTTPHVVVRRRPARRVRLASPQVVPASGRSAARGRSSESGSVARVSSCPATTDRSASHLVVALREDRG